MGSSTTSHTAKQTLLAGTPAPSIYNQFPTTRLYKSPLTNYIKSPNSIGLVPRKTNLSLVENPAFIGSIIDVLVGIVNIPGGFYRSFDKINQNYLTGIKITKLGREIIDISIISPVHTHKLLIPQGIYRNFDIFPQKFILHKLLLQFGVPLVYFRQYSPSLRIF